MNDTRRRTPIHELPDEVLALAFGYVGCDEDRMHAVLRVRFEHAGIRTVARETGIPRSTLSSLCKGFGSLVDRWLQRRAEIVEAA